MNTSPKFILMFGMFALLGCGSESTTPVVHSPAEPLDTSPGEQNAQATDGDDLQLLQGTWEQTVPSFAKGTTITITGTKKAVYNAQQLVGDNITIEIDPTANPKVWDEHLPNSDHVIRGIYKLEGDILTRCFAPADDPRPTDFRSSERPNVGGATAVFKRIK